MSNEKVCVCGHDAEHHGLRPCDGDWPNGQVCVCQAYALPAPSPIEQAQRERLEALEEVAKAARQELDEFEACMKAQKDDLPLPAGHDDVDEACGDFVCFQVSKKVKKALAALSKLDAVRGE